MTRFTPVLDTVSISQSPCSSSRGEFRLVTSLGQSPFNLRHQIAVLEHFPEVQSLFAQNAFASGQRFEKDVKQLRITAQPARVARSQ